MRLEDVEARIGEQYTIIEQAQARLEAWLEVRAAFEESSSAPSLQGQKSSGRKTLVEYIYEAIPMMKGDFTGPELTMVVQKLLERDGVVQRHLKSRVSHVVYQLGCGSPKNAPFYLEATKQTRSTPGVKRSHSARVYRYVGGGK